MQKNKITIKKTKGPSADGPFAREKVYEEMQGSLLQPEKSSLAYGYIISPLVKKVCRNMNSTKIIFLN